jgi:methionyl aminopeptidase
MRGGSGSLGEIIPLHGEDWLSKQRFAGKIAAGALSLLSQTIAQDKERNLLRLNSLAEEYIQDNGCSCTFKGYKGFPAGVCISVNRQLVHGIPIDYNLLPGDIISFDLGTTYQGAIADTAITRIYGEPKHPEATRLLKATEDALLAGIKAVKVGARLGAIGNAISKSARASGYSLILRYGGHHLDWNTPHAPCFVSNKADINEGSRIQVGEAFCIEPMLAFGSSETSVSPDGWSVLCQGFPSAHEEHSVFVHADHVEVITAREVL